MAVILNQDNEDRLWSLYLSSVANPFAEDVTFEQFKAKVNSTRPQTKVNAEVDDGLTNKQIQRELDKAEKMLSGFAPPEKA